MSETKELTAKESFEEKLRNKIQSDIGDLMPDEMLKELVDKSIHNMFFEPVRIKNPGFHSQDTFRPAPFEEIVTNAMQPLMEEAIENWVAENAESVYENLATVIGDGADKMMILAFRRIMKSPFDEFENNTNQRIFELEQKFY